MPASPLAAVLALLTGDPGRPRLTWYGDGGERVELSGAVLANWVTKSANLLVEELDARPGFRLRLDLPGHWRAVVWALAAWRVGACVVVPPDERADAVVTTRPSSHTGTVVAVALPALARRFDEPLPPGAVDGAAVLGYGDALGWVPDADLAAPALVGLDGTTTHAELVRGGGTAERVLVDAAELPLDALLRRMLDLYAAGGSVVLVGEGYAKELRADDERRARLVAAERVTG